MMQKKQKKIPWRLKAGSFLTLFFLILSGFSFFLQPLDMDLSRGYEQPSLAHPFGLDEFGSDVLKQVIFGSRITFITAFSVTLIGLVLGLVLGTLSGFYTKTLDPVLMRVVDMIYAFPGFLLAMALMAVLGSSIFNLILAMSISSWAAFARLSRGEVLYLKNKEFVLSAESLGCSFLRKIIFHIWPNLIPVLAVQTTLTLAGVILTESGLSFLGIGAPPETPTWGAMLQSGRQALIEAPYISFFPGICLFLLIMGIHLMGDGLRQVFSVRLKQS